MKAVTIPFKKQFEDAMIHDRKTATSRTRVYGAVGDRFKAFDYEFEIIGLHYMALSNVAQQYFRQEGFDDPKGFMEIWMKLHRGVWNPSRMVWLHRFKRVSGL